MAQDALDLNDADLCRESGLTMTQWTQFTDPEYKRRITLTYAFKLKDAFGITLEWIYDGDASTLRGEIGSKIRKMQAAA